MLSGTGFLCSRVCYSEKCVITVNVRTFATTVETCPSSLVVRISTYNCDFLANHCYIRSPEMKQGCDGSDTGSINQISIMIQEVNIDTNGPHLKYDTVGWTQYADQLKSLVLLLMVRRRLKT